MIIQKINQLKKLILSLNKNRPVHLSTPSLSNADISNVLRELKLNNLATGKSHNRFQKLLKKYTKSSNLALTSNGTVSLYVALLADQTKINQEILLPSFNYIASANAIMTLNAIPHFIESNMSDLGVDYQKLDEYLKKNTKIKKNKCINIKTSRQIKSLIITHIFGHPNNPVKAQMICKKYKLTLIEDASESLGSFFKKKHLGTFGDYGILSFNGNKIITTGGGGALISKKKSNHKKILKIIDNGKLKHKYEFLYDQYGLNLKMPNINAAIGINQLTKIEKLVSYRRKLYKKYSSYNFKNLSIMKEPINSRSNYWLQAVITNSKKEKNLLIKYFFKEKIMVRSSWKPLHLFKHLKKFPKMKIVNAIKIYNKTFNLPSSIIKE